MPAENKPQHTSTATSYLRRLAQLNDAAHRPLLGQGLRGVERETLRVDAQGRLALTPHARALGSALTHPQITTDYSESLLEFITPPQHDASDVLARLDEIHRFAYSQLGDEMLWSQSMPCPLPDEATIPIAWYGTSNIGQLKHVYRRGLAVRYGKAMQCIAGIHYNFSLADSVWRVLRDAEQAQGSDQDFQSERYIALIRNFHRYSWLLMYLFGASPALYDGFVAGKAHGLERFDDHTLFLPYATSLRMSDLGYQNSAQADVTPRFDSLQSYIDGLTRAVSLPHAPYEAIGTKRDGQWQQLSTNVLQIENEFYSTIRPKRVTYSGERPVQALQRRGVQYVEVRCLDIDPFAPHGVSLPTMQFLDAFLLFCALDDSPLLSAQAHAENKANFAQVVKQGRRPGLELQRDGQAIALRQWGDELLARIRLAADALDAQRGDGAVGASLVEQQAKLDDASLTPSAHVLQALRDVGGDGQGAFFNFAMRCTREHAQYFRSHALPSDLQAQFVEMAAVSLREQAQLEQTQTGDFDAFVAAYHAGALGDAHA
ncbi:glutamate--cysteine ligase [Pandoraea thiooxydans]|uniref:Glutamate--cysteine ligase n=1 Tax=Pandoraea thiooxydans TaxID=445709 RepID=A0A0G3EQ76_9BURK|nr:glutamate--cysteine ligase [Pandoraea thiooxydans]AKJ67442.1 glutamate--cysteine ligase [Pandoraea thiooxydans]APR94475.1 glutamate--cysteine ligase [Pandoraea thiooxydans]